MDAGYVLVRVSVDLLSKHDGWSEPVRAKIEPCGDGTYEMLLRTVPNEEEATDAEA